MLYKNKNSKLSLKQKSTAKHKCRKIY